MWCKGTYGIYVGGQPLGTKHEGTVWVGGMTSHICNWCQIFLTWHVFDVTSIWRQIQTLQYNGCMSMFSRYCLLSTLCVRCVVTMTKTCAVAGCNTNHKRREDGKSVIANPATVFKFPGESKEELLRSWTRFCNRNDDFKITNNRNSGKMAGWSCG